LLFAENIKLLGKFKRKSKININIPYSDYDYEVYEFDEETIFIKFIKKILFLFTRNKFRFRRKGNEIVSYT
jgi:hypothetical protein